MAIMYVYFNLMRTMS